MTTIIRNGEAISLVPAESVAMSKGEAPKSFLSDGNDHYILKRPKKRTFAAIFKESFPKDLENYKNWTIDDFRYNKDKLPIAIKEHLTPYALHLGDLLFDAALGEVLYQLIAKTLFRSFEATETYLHIDSETGEPEVISKYCDHFNEFIEKRLHAAIKRKMTSAAQWAGQNIPRREDLNFTPAENHLLGKLYAIALLTNDWDLVNNIMFSNAGCVGSTDTASKVMVVDGGNKFHFGFDGLTSDESSFQNPLFNPCAPKKPSFSGYAHTLPFDDVIGLKLPRLLISNLFSLAIPELFRGFKETIDEARTALAENPYCIQQAINQIGLFITTDSHKPTIERFTDHRSTLINHSYYFSHKDSAYTLSSLLKARCYCLYMTSLKIEAGLSVEEINLDSLQQYQNAQLKKASTSRNSQPDPREEQGSNAFIRAKL